MKKLTRSAVLLISLAASSLSFAQAPSMVSGTVTKIDEADQKITLDHGAVKNLDMDAMEMAWRVQDPAMLKGLKAGDKVQFTAERVNGALTITKMQKGQ